jgi:PAS domain S-box-containing protein
MDALMGDGDAALAESPLLESPAELEAVLQQVAEGITVQDPNGVLVYANDAAARLIGFTSSAELMATPIDEVTSRFEMYDESGEPFSTDRLPGRLALRGIQSEQVIGYRTRGSSLERWSLVTSSPIFDDSGQVRFAVNAFQDITPHKRAEERLRMLADAGELLASPAGVMETLAQVPQLVVPRLADASSVWVEEAGTLRRLATAATPEHLELYEQLPKTYDLIDDAHVPVVEMYRRGEALFIPEVPAETHVHATRRTTESELVERLGVRAVMAVPLRGQDRSIGLLTFSAFTPDRFREIDFEFARELAARVAAAIEREQRAQAAEALAFTAEGVCLLDVDGRVRLWNPAAVAITGLSERDVVGKRLLEVVPAWARVQDPTPGASAHVVPVEIAGVEHWLSVSTARFEAGTVYAFRDLTQERALEQLKSDFISTISHELRTPLAAIYGASMTLQRADLDAAAVRQDELLQVISSEADRLARTINDVLWASRLESGTLHVRIESCDGGRLAEAVVAARPGQGPPGVGEPGRQRGQVLARRRPDPRRRRDERSLRPLRGARLGPRHPAIRAGARLPEVLPPGSEPDARSQRHRARSLHLPRARPSNGWARLGQVSRKQGLHLRRGAPDRRRTLVRRGGGLCPPPLIHLLGRPPEPHENRRGRAAAADFQAGGGPSSTYVLRRLVQ